MNLSIVLLPTLLLLLFFYPGETNGADAWSPMNSKDLVGSDGGGKNSIKGSGSNKLQVSGGSGSSGSSSNQAVTPSFDTSLPLNVTVQYGAHAHLVCRVHDVSNKSVSWVRKTDGHLLTVDSDTFIGDGRHQVHHPLNSDTWTLHLRGARANDAGKYECQVSSEPKMSLLYQLNVIVPTVEIRGAPDIYVMAGSGVALHCVISGLLETPPFVFWYHKTERIAGSALQEPALQQQKSVSSGGSRSASSSLVDASFIPDSINGQHKESFGATKLGWSARVTRLGPDSLLAVLNVPPATSDFAGNYSCGPPSLQMASVTLHVLNGEQPAAMQHGNKSSQSATTAGFGWWSTALVTFLLTTILTRSLSSTSAEALDTKATEWSAGDDISYPLPSGRLAAEAIINPALPTTSSLSSLGHVSKRSDNRGGS